jgi:hypothetical protein
VIVCGEGVERVPVLPLMVIPAEVKAETDPLVSRKEAVSPLLKLLLPPLTVMFTVAPISPAEVKIFANTAVPSASAALVLYKFSVRMRVQPLGVVSVGGVAEVMVAE